MSACLASDHDLGTESHYLRTTMPIGVADNVRAGIACGELVYPERAAAIHGGTATAAAGAAVVTLRRIDERA
jgi:hypothetical protein